MKPQHLTESGSHDQFTLQSELAKKENLLVELREKNEVNICNYCILWLHYYNIFCKHHPYCYFVGNED